MPYFMANSVAMIAHTFIPPRPYNPPQQDVHTRALASVENSSPFHTVWRGVERPWVSTVNVRMESTGELDVKVAGVLFQAPEVLTVCYLHVSTEVAWTCSAFYTSRTNPECLAGHSCHLHTRT
jgi:hypothetical protein